MEASRTLVEPDSKILVTGAGGFIGRRVVASLIENGLTNIRCLVRSARNRGEDRLTPLAQSTGARIEIFEGNLLSRQDCNRMCKDVQIIYHMAAGRGEKSYASAYLNSVVSTRNLMDACLQERHFKRFVNVSSFAVYSNRSQCFGRAFVDEDCPVEEHAALRADAYCYAKVKQEEIVVQYGERHRLPYVIVRPGVVYGPGNEKIHGRVGIGTFGVFLHLGGSNKVPLTFVDNCAEAIILAGTTSGVEREVFNVVDDDLPSSRRFLRLYKSNVRRFPSIYVPKPLSYFLCFLWEKLAEWSEGQLPNTFNRRTWHAMWKETGYTNDKLKRRLRWSQKVPTSEGLRLYFQSCRAKEHHA